MRKKLTKIINQFDDLPTEKYKNDLLKSITQNKIMSTIWPLLSPDFQQKLLLSYTYRHIFGQVLNIQINNWHSHNIVESEFKKLKKYFTIQKYRVLGNHKENIRFGNIHFATDFIDGKTVYQIHWDKYSPSNILNILKHNIFD